MLLESHLKILLGIGKSFDLWFHIITNMYHNMYSFPSHILALNLLHKILFFHRNEDVSSIIVTQAQQELEETSVESARDKQPIYVEPGIRVVELNRLPDAGLGISIVGGKADSEGLGLKGI